MSKWADYLISKVRYEETENSRFIDKVRVYKDEGEEIGTTNTWGRIDVINKIDSGYAFCTIY